MNSVEALKLLTPYISFCDSTRLSAFVTDQTLAVRGASKNAIAMYPVLSKPDGLKVLMPACADLLSPLFTSREGQELNIPFSKQYAAVTPLFHKGEPIGTLVILSSAPITSDHQRTVQLNQMLSAFSGQFREPLSNFHSMLNLIKDKYECFEGEDELLCYRILNQNTYRMLRNIANMTDLMAFTGGVDVLFKHPVSLRQMVSSLGDTLRILLVSADVRFSYSLDLPADRNLHFIADEGKLVRAILHLVSNSAKSCREVRDVLLAVRVNGNQLSFTVSDHGTGIPTASQEKIFYPYYSVPSETSRLTSLGIGLTITKHIVSAHGGTIVLRSSEQEGTSVSFSIPVHETTEDPPMFSPTSAIDYLSDSFADPYIQLSDICKCPES